MPAALDATESALRDALVRAYRPWIERRVTDLALAAPPALRTAITEGEAWLGEQLAALLAAPADAQRRGPLEIFQEAMRYPTEVLAAEGLPPVARDDGVRRALPGDTYDLAPASSQDLGEEAWQAHLAWGAAKAAALTAPDPPAQVAYVGNNLMDRSTIDGAARRAGLEVAAFATGAAFAAARVGAPAPLVVLVDLTIADADDALRAGAGSGRVIAFGPHVDDWALDRARSLGADQALPRSRFFRTLDDLLPKRV